MSHPGAGHAKAGADSPRIDASTLPRITFGHQNITWWATAGFIAIEGTTLVVLMVSYVYLRRNFPQWPPAPTALPDLLVPSINLVVLLSTIIPMAFARRAAQEMDLRRVRIWLVVTVLLSIVAVALRGFEFTALNVRWDANAYGSIVWMLLGMHSTLLLVDLLETTVIAAITFTRRMERKHFVDIEEAGLYQFFLSLSWVPVYLLVFIGPRVF
jgi:heme/copper-type cytochrome/quinol oxidase subunit 3